MASTTGSLTTTGSVALSKSNSDTLVQVQISGTYGTVTFVFEASLDGTNYAAILAKDISTGAIVTGSIAPADNATACYEIPSAGYAAVRLRTTAVGSGTLAVALQSASYIGIPVTSKTDNTTFGATSFAGAVTNTSSIKSSGATSGVGYATGAGGAVTQITSRTTGVTLNTVSGAITLVSAAGSATAASFTVTNSAVAATDTVSVVQKSGTDLYEIFVTNVGAGSFKITSFTTGGTTTEQPVFNFNVIKGVAS